MKKPLHPKYFPLVALGIALLLVVVAYPQNRDVGRNVGSIGLMALFAIGFVAWLFAVYLIGAGLPLLVNFLTGRVVGFKFYGLQFLGLDLRRLTTGYRFGWSQDSRYARRGGGLIMVPTTVNRAVHKHKVFMTSGQIVSAVLMVGGFAIYHQIRGDSSSSAPTLDSWQGLVASSSAAIATISLWRIFMGSFRRWHPDDKVYAYQLAAAMVQVPWTHGLRARDWNAEAIQFLLENDSTPPWEAFARLLAHYQAFDSENFSLALTHIQEGLRMIEKIEDRRWPAPAVREEAAYAIAYAQRQAASARQILDRVKPEPNELYSPYDRALSAVLYAEGRHGEAVAQAEEAKRKYLATIQEPFQDNEKVELDLIARVVDRPMATPI